MKALITISFAIEGLDEDDLAPLVKATEDGIRSGVANAWVDGADAAAFEEAIDYYGATLTLKRPLLEEGAG